MEPEFYYVRDTSSKAAHHWDYFGNRDSRALCGHRYEGGIAYEGPDRPRSVCRACQAALPGFEAHWWRSAAEAADRERTQLLSRLARVEGETQRLAEELAQQQRVAKSASNEAEPCFYFVRDSMSPEAHHWDYFHDEPTKALCGYTFE